MEPHQFAQCSPSSQHQVMLCPWFKTRKLQVSGMLAPKPHNHLIQELHWGENTLAPCKAPGVTSCVWGLCTK